MTSNPNDYDNTTRTVRTSIGDLEYVGGFPTEDTFITDGDGFFEGTLSDGITSGQYAEVSKGDSTAMNIVLTRK